jgi:Mg2+ and Co2+ transporter CorA
MQQFFFYTQPETQQCTVRAEVVPDGALAFIWMDCLLTELQQPERWQQQIFAQTQLWINEYHIADLANIEHPSNFDSTQNYDLLIFRKLITQEDHFKQAEQQMHGNQRLRLEPAEGFSTPVSLCIAPKVLISIRDERNSAAKQFVERFHTLLQQATGQAGHNSRVPNSPLDLSLKLLNVVIDRYLEIRQPLTQRVNFWQNALLQSDSRFRQWQDLFQENMALQQIESLCEEQMDVLQELRDAILENPSQCAPAHALESQDITLVRVHDLLSHVERVQKHISRLESMIKTAIDLHFSAISNQSNEHMRILAIITAIFSPLSLLTGIYGMNFVAMPGLKNPYGFWLMLLGMLLTTVVLLLFFRRKRLLGRSQQSLVELLAAGQGLDFKKLK